MKLKFLLDVDCVNYKKISMFLGFPNCNWKCGRALCQNNALAQEPSVDIGYEPLIQRYLNNPLSEAIVCGGLDPFDSWEELKIFVSLFREKSSDPIVIYTGYNEEEIQPQLIYLKNFPNIVVKFGRFEPDQPSHLDEVLGVQLASPNQYARQIS